ncbi:MAG: extracellular solute-binding protein [Hyphomicrobiaceae bacterium]|nr:extracellular solute-binding protein [Hyphomicrobiaceae bacterium]MCC0024512.1 extracellular solute-binding protein [Hyphomicrobiaceae bacterium]
MAKVRFCGPDTDAYVDSIVRHADEFTAKTGVELDITIVPSDEYFSNQIDRYLKGPGAADIFMSGPVLLWQHVGAGLVAPLEDLFEASSAEFDHNDFFPSLIASNRWSGKFGDRLGLGSLWEIPVNYETYNLAYVPETLSRYNVPVPQTWEELFALSAKIQTASAGKIRGFAQRGIQVWHTMYTGYATQFWAYGAEDFDETGKCAIGSAEGIAATSDFVAALRECGPSDWLNQRWYELALDFADKKYGFIVDSDHYVAFYEDPSKSSINGKTGYALPPAGPTGRRESNMWTWSLVMNANAPDKSAAWQFIEWAAGKQFLLRSAFEGNMNPTRRSIWDDASFKKVAADWGDYYPVARELIEGDARVLVTPSPRYLDLADRWVRGIRAAFSEEVSVADALASAAKDIDRLLGN